MSFTNQTHHGNSDPYCFYWYNTRHSINEICTCSICSEDRRLCAEGNHNFGISTGQTCNRRYCGYTLISDKELGNFKYDNVRDIWSQK